MKEIKNKNPFVEDGIILLNKKKGISSFAAINKLKWLINAKKVGHAGTLDPMAEGLLIVLINGFTKFSQHLMKKNKTYEVSMDIGYSTDTYDLDGEVVERGDKLSDILKKNGNIFLDKYIQNVLKSFEGKQKQLPPMYSAIKVNGQKLYDLARKGIEIERKKRDIEIYEITDIVYSIEKSSISFKTNVSSGTYIRSLVYDIGKKMGTYATMTYLKRVSIDKYNIENSVTIDDINNYFYENRNNLISQEELCKILKFIDIQYLLDYEKLYLNEEDISKIRNGMTVKLDEKIDENKNYKVYSKNDDKFIGIVKSKTNGYVKRDKYFI